MSVPRLSVADRRRIAAEVKRAIVAPDGQINAQDAARIGAEWVRPPRGGLLTADYLLVKAVDRFVSGDLSEEELYRLRVIAFYMVFAVGGEEWQNMGVAFGHTMGRPQTPRKLPKLKLPDDGPDDAD